MHHLDTCDVGKPKLFKSAPLLNSVFFSASSLFSIRSASLFSPTAERLRMLLPRRSEAFRGHGGRRGRLLRLPPGELVAEQRQALQLKHVQALRGPQPLPPQRRLVGVDGAGRVSGGGEGG